MEDEGCNNSLVAFGGEKIAGGDILKVRIFCLG